MGKKSLILTFFLLTLFALNKSPFCEESGIFKDEAVKYRLDGLAAQQKGDFDTALISFQKAISIDPAYAVAHNDLGVIYEEKGLIERAESEYLEAVKIDANYLPAYANLALLYEAKGDIDKAIHYWRQRATLGFENDPWTIKAKENLKRLNAPLKEPVVIDEESGLAMEKLLYQEAQMLSKSVTLDKEMLLEKQQAEFEEHKSKGQSYFDEGKFDAALEELRMARSLDPLNEDVNLLIENAEFKYAENLITTYYNNGLDFFKQRDYATAKVEFRKIINILQTIVEEQEKEEAYSTPTR